MLENEREAGFLVIGCFFVPLLVVGAYGLAWSGPIGILSWLLLLAIAGKFGSSLKRTSEENFFAKRKRASRGLRRWIP